MAASSIVLGSGEWISHVPSVELIQSCHFASVFHDNFECVGGGELLHITYRAPRYLFAGTVTRGDIECEMGRLFLLCHLCSDSERSQEEFEERGTYNVSGWVCVNSL